jgi:transcriptional regulator with XRE-family HTH domain
MSEQLFGALLRYWRGRRGLSQLELALQADVSARHVSFLEVGRAKPSSEMVLRLLAVLDVPLQAQNEALRAAGLEARFPEPGLDALDIEIQLALARMMEQQEPFPLTVIGGDFGILRSNQAAQRLFRAFLVDVTVMPEKPDMFTLLFDPRLMRPYVENWELLARGMLNRLQRELLRRGGDDKLRSLLERVLAFPGVPASWRHPDFSTDAPAAQSVRLTKDGVSLGFLVTITKFSAPQQVLLDELTVESCFPLDDATRVTCERLARE